jgi:hypothetical protein
MPDKWPLANGNWSNAANWNGGTKPVNGDDIYMDGRTIALDESVNQPLSRLFTTARSGGTAGGTLNLSGTFDITLLALTAGSTSAISIGVNCTANITIATINGSTNTNSIPGITVTAGINFLTFTNCLFLGGAGANRAALWPSGGAGTIAFVNCTATARNAHAILINGGTHAVSGTLHLINDALSTAQVVNWSGNNTNATLSGNWTVSGSASQFAYNASSGTITYNILSLNWGTVPNTGVGLISQAVGGNFVAIAPAVVMHANTGGPLLIINSSPGSASWIGNVTIQACDVFQASGAGSRVEHTGELIYGSASSLSSGTITASTGIVIVDTIRNSGTYLPKLDRGTRFKNSSRIIGQRGDGTQIVLLLDGGVPDIPLPINVRQGVLYMNSTLVGTYDAGAEIAQSVWQYSTRTITAGGLDAAGVRAAVGLAAANLDSQLASVDTVINVLPLNAAVQSRVRGTTIEVFSGETVLVSIAVLDAAGNAVSLTGRTLRIVLESPGSTADRTVIEDGSIARSGNTVSFAIVGGSTGARRLWSLRDTSGDVVLAHGVVSTTYAPKKD